VTGVCSTRNLDLVRSIGADHVIDYVHEDFTRHEGCYDLILDIVANRSVSQCVRALSPSGIYVAVAFSAAALLGPLISRTGGKEVRQLSHEPNTDDLAYMKELIEAGTVVPVVDSQYPLGQIGEAFRRYAEGNPAGKVVLTHT
jgi:NADPH:quinone reductase-like Zn-dependent oxidoreductase